jgi:regulatory protein
MEAAATFLAVRPRSTEETRRRLNHLGYPAALADTVIARLVEMGYLDDADFARLWVESRDRARPRGATALRRELELKGIERDIIEDILEAREERARDDDDPATPGADEAAARHLLDRRGATLRREADPRKRRQKAYALLARHGFSPDVCGRLASAVDDAQGHP